MPLFRSSNAGAIADESGGPAVETLLADLLAQDVATRRNAARDLAGCPQAAPALCAAVALEAHESVRVPMFTALIRIGTKEAASGLIPLLASEDPGLRNGAIEALKTMPGSAAECISEIFAGSTDVRIFGVEILGALAHPERQNWLLQVIEADDEVNVCAAAVEALLDCGDRAAIGPLQALLARYPDEPFLAFSIRAVLERIKGSS